MPVVEILQLLFRHGAGPAALDPVAVAQQGLRDIAAFAPKPAATGSAISYGAFRTPYRCERSRTPRSKLLDDRARGEFERIPTSAGNLGISEA